MFSVQKSKCPCRFLEINPDCLHRCLRVSAKPLAVFSFFAGFFWSPKTQISQKIQKYIYLTKKEEKTFVNGLEGVYTKFQGISPKNGGDIGCLTNLGRHAWASLYEEMRSHYELSNYAIPSDLKLTPVLLVLMQRTYNSAKVILDGFETKHVTGWFPVWWVRNLVQCLVKKELMWVVPRAKR